MDVSLKTATLDYLLQQIPSELVVELENRALYTKKRNVYFIEDWDDVVGVVNCFENVSITELPTLIAEIPDERIKRRYGSSLLRHLVCKHRNLFPENIELFREEMEVLKEAKNNYEKEKEVYPSVIRKMYTLLSPEELIKDVSEISKGCLFFCFEDDKSWDYIKKRIYNPE
jgi:hypothetical protein